MTSRWHKTRVPWPENKMRMRLDEVLMQGRNKTRCWYCWRSTRNAEAVYLFEQAGETTWTWLCLRCRETGAWRAARNVMDVHEVAGGIELRPMEIEAWR